MSSNGLITKIWGRPGWIFNHSVTFGYPVEPSDEQKAAYRQYFKSIGDILPCRYCRESYQKFITSGDTELTDKDLESRDSLTKWFFRVHTAVNNKLGVDYGVTYDDIAGRYESFRAQCKPQKKEATGCLIPLDYKAYSYRSAVSFDPPLIPIEIADRFIRLAKMYNMDDKYYTFITWAKQCGIDVVKKQPPWIMRNRFCQKQIHYMRIAGLPSVGDNGLPTIDEVVLILHLSSNLPRSELDDCLLALDAMPDEDMSFIQGGGNSQPELWIKEPWLYYIQMGKKTVEGRTGDTNKYRNWIGQRVLFKSNERQIPVKVTSITHYPDLDAYVDGEPDTAPHLTAKQDIINAYHEFYDDAKIQKAGGMVGIHFELI